MGDIWMFMVVDQALVCECLLFSVSYVVCF